jgi:HEAT repeat protein
MRRLRWHCGLVAAGLALACLPTAARAQGFLGKTAATWAKDLDPGKTPEQRRSAAFALGKIGAAARDALGPLAARLSDDDGRVREAAAYAIGEICAAARAPYPDATKPLCARLADPKEDPLVRRSAAFALGAMRKPEPEVLDALRAALKARGEKGKVPDPCATVRQSVAWALGQMKDAAADSLREALADDDVLVRRDAARALSGLSVDAARKAIPELARHCLAAEKGADSVQRLEMRKAATAALVRLAGPDPKIRAAAETPLLRLLKDNDPEVRHNAAMAVGRLGGPRSLAVAGILLETLERGDPATKAQVSAVLEGLGPAVEAAVTTLMQALAKKDEASAKQQIEDLSKLLTDTGPLAREALPQLQTALQEAVPQLRAALGAPAATREEKEDQQQKIQQATVACMTKALSGAVARLDKVLRDSQKFQREIREALAKSPEKGERLRKQQERHNELQQNLAVAFTRMRGAASPAFDALLTLFADRPAAPSARKEAAVALSRVGDRPAVTKALPTLLRVIEDRTEAGIVRERGLWVLRTYLNGSKEEKEKEPVYKALTKVLSEPLAKDRSNKMLRYDSAYLLSFFQGENVHDKALDMLGEWLKDPSTKIYLTVNVTGVNPKDEKGQKGKINVGDVGFGDGRQLAVEALQVIGPGRVARRPDLVIQLRALQANPKTADNLRDVLKEFMPELEKELKSK